MVQVEGEIIINRAVEEVFDSSMIETEGALTFRSVAAGTRIRRSWEVRPRGAIRLMTPLVGLLGRRQEGAIWSELRRVLEAQSEKS